MNTKFSRFLQQNFHLLACSCVFTVFLFALLNSCAPPKGSFAGNPTGETNSAFSNYIIVSNNTTKNVVLLDPDGNYVRTLLQIAGTNTDIPWGLAMYDSENVLITIEGVDRIMKANLRTGVASNYIVDANVTGTMRGITRMTGGDILFSEGAAAGQTERFSGGDTPGRYNTAAFPLNYLNTATGMASLSNNGWVQCSTGAQNVRTYTNAGATVATATATAPVPSLGAAHNVNGCRTSSTGQIVVTYNGTTDSIRVYPTSAMATTQYTFTNTAILANPADASFRPNGLILAVDATSNLMVEIDPSGSTTNPTRTLSSPWISTPNQMLVVP